MIFFSFSGESGDSSLVVSLEINSVMYQGVLFAQPSSLGSSKVTSSSAPLSTGGGNATKTSSPAAVSNNPDPNSRKEHKI